MSDFVSMWYPGIEIQPWWKGRQNDGAYLYNCRVTIVSNKGNRRQYHYVGFIVKTKEEWTNNRNKYLKFIKKTRINGKVWRRTETTSTAQILLNARFPVSTAEANGPMFYEAYYNGCSIWAKDIDGQWRKVSLRHFNIELSTLSID